MSASKLGDTESVRTLLEADADTEAVDYVLRHFSLSTMATAEHENKKYLTLLAVCLLLDWTIAIPFVFIGVRLVFSTPSFS